MTAILTVLLCAFLFLCSCGMQQYQARTLDVGMLGDRYQARSLTHNPQLIEYMLSQNYSKQNLPIQSWGIDELTLAAFYFNPRLATARAKWEAEHSKIAVAQQIQNPNLALRSQHHSNAVGKSPWSIEVSLGIPIRTADKKAAQIEQALYLANSQALLCGQLAWEIRSQLHQLWINYNANKEQLHLLQTQAATETSRLKLLNERSQAGYSDRLLATQKQQDLLQLKLRIQSHQDQQATLLNMMAQTIGISAAALSAVPLNPHNLVPQSTEPLMNVQETGLLNRLDIHASLAQYAAAEAQLKLEIARQYPDFVFAPGYAFDQNDHIWSLGLRWTMTWINRNKAGIAKAIADRETAAAQFHQLQASVIHEFSQAQLQVQQRITRYQAAQELLLAQYRLHAHTEKRVSMGYQDQLELLQSQLLLLQVQQQVLHEKIQLQQAEAALENTVQHPLRGIRIPMPPVYEKPSL